MRSHERFCSVRDYRLAPLPHYVSYAVPSESWQNTGMASFQVPNVDIIVRKLIFGFEIVTAVVMNVAMFWDIETCSPYANRRFGLKFRLHLQAMYCTLVSCVVAFRPCRWR
jgi:hypothetical protein